MRLDFSHLPRTEKVLVACSGGADSIALLLALHGAEYSLVGAHINHGTRGTENEIDETFVRELCAQLEIPFAVTRLNFATSNPNEAEMRDARYNALSTLARKYSCARIVTGHTADDLLETMLLNWLRGATVAGFSGIAPVRALESGVLLVRPMLLVAREEVRAFLISIQQSWREDASNASTQFARNRIRHELLPLLINLSGEASTRRLALQSARAALVQRDDLEFLNQSAQVALEELVLKREENLLVLCGARFVTLPVALQRRVLRAAAMELGSEDAREVGLEKIEATRAQILQNQRRALWQWSKTLRVEWTGEHSGQRIRFSRV